MPASEKSRRALRDESSFLQYADRRKDGRGYGRRLTAGLALCAATQIKQDSGFRLVGVIVGRLRRRRPQHQGQAQPSRPSYPDDA